MLELRAFPHACASSAVAAEPPRWTYLPSPAPNSAVLPNNGRSPSYLMRQLYDFRYVGRGCSLVGLMKPVVTNLTNDEMTAIVAYLASLQP